jgi:epoxyqueuosine reductase QueG
MEEHCFLTALGGGTFPKPHPGRCRECAMHARVVPSIAAAFLLLDMLVDEVKDALPLMAEHVNKYRSHKLRETWQRESLDALRRPLVEDPAHLLVVLGHKQQVSFPPPTGSLKQPTLAKSVGVGWRGVAALILPRRAGAPLTPATSTDTLPLPPPFHRHVHPGFHDADGRGARRRAGHPDHVR